MCRLQAALQEASPGTNQVPSILVNVQFPLRLPGLTAIMGRFTKQGRWAVSLEIFQVLPALGLERDTTVCNAALAACVRGCAWHRAKQVFNLMLAERVHMDYITYYTMLSVPRRRKLWRVVIEVWCPGLFNIRCCFVVRQLHSCAASWWPAYECHRLSLFVALCSACAMQLSSTGSTWLHEIRA